MNSVKFIAAVDSLRSLSMNQGGGIRVSMDCYSVDPIMDYLHTLKESGHLFKVTMRPYKPKETLKPVEKVEKKTKRKTTFIRK